MTPIVLSLLVAVTLGAAPDGGRGAAPVPSDRTLPRASWAPQDAADSLWRRGRLAIAEESWRDAAMTFERLATRSPNSAYAGDALYWQAFALQRLGSSSDLRAAVRALEVQKEKYPRSATFTSGESGALMTRINGRLARGGDPTAAASIAEMAEAIAQVAAAASADAVAAVAPVVSASVSEAFASDRVAREMERAAMQAERAAVQADRAAATGDRSRGRDEIPAECEGVIKPEQVEAMNALMQMNADNAMPILKRVLARRDRCSEILRRKAVFLVSQKRTDEAVDILVSTAKTDPDIETRDQAVFWLSQTRSPRVVEVLEQILNQATDTKTQERAVYSLAQTRSERAGVILRDFAKRRDAFPEARVAAIFWLGQRRDPETSSFLRDLFPSLETSELREKAVFAISQQRNPENARFLLGIAKNRQYDTALRKQALFWASEQRQASVTDLGQVYDAAADDAELREQVIFALSQRRNDTAAVDKLVAIARTERNTELRSKALFWLGQTRDPRVPALLEEIINNP